LLQVQVWIGDLIIFDWNVASEIILLVILGIFNLYGPSIGIGRYVAIGVYFYYHAWTSTNWSCSLLLIQQFLVNIGPFIRFDAHNAMVKVNFTIVGFRGNDGTNWDFIFKWLWILRSWTFQTRLIFCWFCYYFDYSLTTCNIINLSRFLLKFI
jgi:hypothetical protein